MGDEEEIPKEPSKFDGILGLLIFIPLFVFFIFIPSFVWWLFWWNHPSPWGDKIIAYPIICSTDYKGVRCPGKEKLGLPIRYSVSKDRAEVFVLTIKGVPPKKTYQV